MHSILMLTQTNTDMLFSKTPKKNLSGIEYDLHIIFCTIKPFQALRRLLQQLLHLKCVLHQNLKLIKTNSDILLSEHKTFSGIEYDLHIIFCTIKPFQALRIVGAKKPVKLWVK